MRVCVCACVCACVRACVQLCVRVCMRACLRARARVLACERAFARRRRRVPFVFWRGAPATINSFAFWGHPGRL